jgi:hypothetical protein
MKTQKNMNKIKLQSTYTPSERPNFNDWAKHIDNTAREVKGLKKRFKTV